MKPGGLVPLRNLASRLLIYLPRTQTVSFLDRRRLDEAGGLVPLRNLASRLLIYLPHTETVSLFAIVVSMKLAGRVLFLYDP